MSCPCLELLTEILIPTLFKFLRGLVTTGTVIPMLVEVMSVVPREKIAVHFHDTYGQALPNILASLQVSKRLLV
jgi:hypothetical protein